MTVNAKRLVKSIREQRLGERKRIFSAANEAHDHFARQSGAFMWGRGRNGKPAQTKTLRKLGIEGPDGDGMVIMPFKRADIAKLEGIPVEEADRIIKKGKEPRKTVKIKLHILRAVRQEKHICDGYGKEIAATDTLLSALDALNIQLARMRKPPAAEIEAAISKLQAFKTDVLSKKRSAVKKVASMGKLDKLIGKLEEIKGSSNPDFGLGTACRIFVAFRDRLGTWREEQVAGLAKYNSQKEYALRAVRDEWVYSQLMMFVEDVHAAFMKYPPPKAGEESKVGSPRCILEELARTDDRYLAGILLELEPAVDAFEKRKPTARGRFMQVRDRLGRMMHPNPQEKN